MIARLAGRPRRRTANCLSLLGSLSRHPEGLIPRARTVIQSTGLEAPSPDAESRIRFRFHDDLASLPPVDAGPAETS